MRPINLNLRNRVITLLRDGFSTRKVSQRTGVSLGTVAKIRKETCGDVVKSSGGTVTSKTVTMF